MNCSFCHSHSRKAKTMSEDEFESILSALKGKTKHLYYHLMGEPLTHPLLPTFIKKANEQGFRSLITTNGTLIAKKGKELLESGLYKINLSLHSFEGKDEEYFLHYINDIIDFVELAKSTRTIVVLRLWNKGVDGGLNDKVISLLHSKIEGEWTENERGIKIRNKLHIEWGERFEWPDKDAPLYGDNVFCYGMRDHFGILSDGTVVPCCLDSDGAISLGNVFEESLDDILNSTRAQAIKRGFGSKKAVEDLCKRCGYARRFNV